MSLYIKWLYDLYTSISAIIYHLLLPSQKNQIFSRIFIFGWWEDAASILQASHSITSPRLCRAGLTPLKVKADLEFSYYNGFTSISYSLKVDSMFGFRSHMNGWVSVLNQGRDFLPWFEEIILTLLDILCDFENRSCWCLPVTHTQNFNPTSY